MTPFPVSDPDFWLLELGEEDVPVVSGKGGSFVLSPKGDWIPLEKFGLRYGWGGDDSPYSVSRERFDAAVRATLAANAVA